MDDRGQIYFEDEGSIPPEDVERLREAELETERARLHAQLEDDERRVSARSQLKLYDDS